MIWPPILSVVTGIAVGYFLFPMSLHPIVSNISSYALIILLFGVGIDLGLKDDIWKSFKKVGFKVLFVPLGVVIGTLIGSILAGYLVHLPLNEALAIGAGFGWYSLSGVILNQIYHIETGTLAFITNVMREFLAIITIPILANKMSHLSAVAPGGATTMDTTLPLISQATKSEMTVIAFINGVILSSLVPLLVHFFISI